MSHPPAVARVLERVATTVREHEMIAAGEAVLVSVSGGPDSVCLLEALHRLRRLLKIELAVFHLDHRLRPDSATDAAYVRRLAARLGVPCAVRVSGSAPARGESVEAWARGQRLWHLAEVRTELGADRIAEGHTMNDQAETVLIALMRGGGLEALSGIAPVLGSQVQPLIETSREDVEAFCRALRLRPRRDPSNQDVRLLRNAVRLRVLPELERASGRELVGPIARTAALLRRDEHELARRAYDATRQLVEQTSDGARVEAVELLTIGRAVASRVVRSAIYGLDVLPTEDAIAAVLDLAAGRPGRRRDLPGGLVAVREGRYVVLRLPPARDSQGGRR
jgi:tRNA(Ile)-lysidine synthase